MTGAGRGRVVLGFDGRWQSSAILDMAADEAVRLGRPLSIVTIVHAPDDVTSTMGRPADGWHPHARVRQSLAGAVRHIRRRHERLRIATSCVDRAAVRPDVEPFQSAVLLVLGEHGNHGVEPFGPESASRILRGAVTCPVLLVPDDLPTAATPRPSAVGRN